MLVYDSIHFPALPGSYGLMDPYVMQDQEGLQTFLIAIWGQSSIIIEKPSIAILFIPFYLFLL